MGKDKTYKQKKNEVAILITYKINFETINVTINKEEQS